VLTPADDDTLLDDLRAHDDEVIKSADIRVRRDEDHAQVAVVLHSAVHPSRLARSLALARGGSATHVILGAEHTVALTALQTAGVATSKIQVVPIGVEALVLELVDQASRGT
jgi:hypothetical protein